MKKKASGNLKVILEVSCDNSFQKISTSNKVNSIPALHNFDILFMQKIIAAFLHSPST